MCILICHGQVMAAALLRLISGSFYLYSSHSTTQVTQAHMFIQQKQQPCDPTCALAMHYMPIYIADVL